MLWMCTEYLVCIQRAMHTHCVFTLGMRTVSRNAAHGYYSYCEYDMPDRANVCIVRGVYAVYEWYA